MVASTPEGTVPVKVVWGFSADTASQMVLSNRSLVIRTPGWRAQVKPVVYWPSMVRGVTSLRGVMPLESSVASEKVWPARTCSPMSDQSTVP